MADQNIERIIAYLSTHSNQYSLESLRTQLLNAGYQLADVETAIARFNAMSAAPPRTDIPLPEPPVQASTINLADPTPTPTPTINLADPTPTPTPTINLAATAPAAIPLTPEHSINTQKIAEARSYIEANAARYEVTALRNALAQSGYSADVIAAALVQIGRIKAPRKTPTRTGPPRAWPYAIGVAVVNYAALFLLVGIDSALAGNGVAFGIGAVLLLGGEAAAWSRLRRDPREHIGRIIGLGALFTVLFSVGSLIVLALIFGVFAALLSGNM